MKVYGTCVLAQILTPHLRSDLFSKRPVTFRVMTSPGYPLFTSIDGYPLNFRLLCNRSSVKTEFLLKIRNHGGVVRKSHESLRLILVGGSLPCERGHYKCTVHPPFSKEPAFKTVLSAQVRELVLQFSSWLLSHQRTIPIDETIIQDFDVHTIEPAFLYDRGEVDLNWLTKVTPLKEIAWVDDCLSERELVDIKGYLLNSSPAFARTDYMKKLHEGTYAYKPTVPTTIPEPSADDYTKIDVRIPCNGDSNCSLESDSIVMAACQRALTITAATLGRSDGHSSSQGCILLSSASVAAKNTEDVSSAVNRISQDPFNILINSQGSSTPLRNQPVPPKNHKSFITGSEGITFSSGSDEEARNDPPELTKSSDHEGLNSAQQDVPTSLSPQLDTAPPSSEGLIAPTPTMSFQRNELEKENSAQLDVPTPLSPQLDTASCSIKGPVGPTQTTSTQRNELEKENSVQLDVPTPRRSPQQDTASYSSKGLSGRTQTVSLQRNELEKENSAQLDVPTPLSPQLDTASCSIKGPVGPTQTTSSQRNELEKENSVQLDVPTPRRSPQQDTASHSSKGLSGRTQTVSLQRNELEKENSAQLDVRTPLPRKLDTPSSSKGPTGLSQSSLFLLNEQEKDGPRIPTTFSSSSDSDSPPRAKQRKTTTNIARTEQDSSDTDLEFGPPPGAIVRLKGVRQNTKEPYTRNEEVAILKYILASKKLTGIKSNVIWKAMDNKPGLEKRSWHSLKNHFLKYMLPNLERYSILTPDHIMKLRRTAVCFSKNKNSQEPGCKL